MDKIISKLRASPFEKYEESFSKETATFIKANTENGKRRYCSAFFEGCKYKVSKAQHYVLLREVIVSATESVDVPINLLETEDQVIENLDRITRHEKIELSPRALKICSEYPLIRFVQPYPTAQNKNIIVNGNRK